MRRHTTLWGLLREVVFGCPYAKQHERIEKALKAKAQRAGDAEFNRTMANFYTDRVLDLNPHDVDQVWGFADAKQKQHDHQQAFLHNESQVAEAQARVEAETERLKEMK